MSIRVSLRLIELGDISLLFGVGEINLGRYTPVTHRTCIHG